MKRFIFLTLLAGAIIHSALAATFTANGGAGSSTVGPGGDYPNLAAAAADFNGAQPVTGNYTFFVTGNLTEPNNVAFGKNTNGFTVTVKPAPATSPVVTFTTTSGANSGAWLGHLLIGTTSTVIASNELIATKNFVIDGSNGAGATRNLTITNNQITSPSVVVRVVGGCEDVTVKNCVIENQTSATTVVTATEAICVELTSRRDSSSVDRYPRNCRIENCDLRTTNSDNGQTIVMRNSGTLASGIAMDGIVITGNEMTGTHRNIFMGWNGNTVISNNLFTVDSRLQRPEAITHTSSNNLQGWTVDFFGNRFLLTRNTKATPATGVNFQLNAGTAGITNTFSQGTYNIYNNFFGGLDYSGVTVVNGNNTNALMRNIVQSGTTSSVTMNIYHNSFNFANFPGVTGTDTQGRIGNIAITGTSPNNTTANMYNNVFRCEQNNAKVFYAPAASTYTGAFSSESNIIYTGSAGAKVALFKGTDYITLPSWQALGFDQVSVNTINPSTLWVSNSDLHLTSDPGNEFGGLNSGLLIDYDGQPRSTSVPYRGADERTAVLSSPSTAASDWQIFQ